MSRRSGITKKQLEKWLDNPFYKRNPEIRARIDAELAGAKDTESQRNRLNALVKESEDPKGMVQVPDQVSVRITRYIPDRRSEQDDDNTVGGAKQLRDAIAELCGRSGDSEKDGFVSWEIVTKTGPFGLKIEVFDEN